MSRQYLRAPNGQLLGWIDDRGNELVGFNANAHRVGRYDKRTNATYDENCHRIGSGNLLATLIIR